jgi:beta-galactosidase
MLYGVSYYPEHKNEEELQQDLNMIIESGINTVRMGEFAWCSFEPLEGEFHFDWLDYAVEVLGKAGIKTIICTPTACPPAWMIEKHPDILYVDNRGVRRPFGGRRHYCYNNENYRRYCVKITEKIAQHYGKNPYVAGFQIDNELAQEVTGRCCCTTCKEKFRSWLKVRYHTIEELNRRSGGIFWSQEYTSFEQINPPVNTIEVDGIQQINAFYENPTIRLDFERFSSDSIIDFQNLQTGILKKYSIYPVTTNATGLATNSIDYYKGTKELDCYGFDYYPGLRDAAVDSFPYAFARGVKEGKPFWVLEFVSGGGHRLRGSGRLQPNPGALKQAVLHSFAHGAEMMLHFQYRSFPMGAEQLNYAIVDLDGVPRRRYYEMKETAELLKKLEPLSKSEFCNEIAICVDYDVHWALRIKPVNDPLFQYFDYCTKLYQCLKDMGFNADVVSYGQDFSRYKMVIIPTGFILPVELRHKLKNFVQEGGVLAATFLTSVKNEDNIGYTETLPAGLTDLFGVTIEEVEPVFEMNHTGVKIKEVDLEAETKDNLWSELLNGNAQMIGQYSNDYKKDYGVISKNKYGTGLAYYIGTDMETKILGELLSNLAKEAGISANSIIGNSKMDIIRRKLGDDMLYFIFNFNGEDSEILLPDNTKDYFTGEEISGIRNIEQNGYRIVLRNEKEAKGDYR